MDRKGYLARSARIVFGDRTWWWRSPLLSVIVLVPLVGPFVLAGYRMVLMRDAAWGVDRGLPGGSQSGEVLRDGVYAFVVGLVWGLVLVPVLVATFFGWFIAWLPHSVPGVPPVVPWWLFLPTSLLGVALGVLSNVAILRTAIYQNVSAGLSLSGVRALIKAGRAGFARVTWLMLSVAVSGVVVSTLLGYVRQMVFHLSGSAATAATYGSTLIIELFLIPLDLIVACAYGLWAAETDPASWPPLRQPASGGEGAA